MIYQLRRHPLPIVANLQHVLVLTYALPQDVLTPLLPPGLTLDTLRGMGFLAIGLVQTQRLRPAGLPAIVGQDFFLAGYRIFTKLHTADGRTLRGLRILRSDADRRLMVTAGNLLTHYNYQLCRAQLTTTPNELEIQVVSHDGQADLHVRADISRPVSDFPPNSPFASRQEARRFAGPLPFTFDYEPQTHSIVVIKGVRQNWHPRPVCAQVLTNTFFEQPAFRRVTPILASAFHIADVPYRWEPGRIEPLPREVA